MPVIARFYGVIIKMYFSQSEHGVPHFHAVYAVQRRFQYSDVRDDGRRSSRACAATREGMGRTAPARIARDVGKE